MAVVVAQWGLRAIGVAPGTSGAAGHWQAEAPRPGGFAAQTRLALPPVLAPGRAGADGTAAVLHAAWEPEGIVGLYESRLRPRWRRKVPAQVTAVGVREDGTMVAATRQARGSDGERVETVWWRVGQGEADGEWRLPPGHSVTAMQLAPAGEAVALAWVRPDTLQSGVTLYYWRTGVRRWDWSGALSPIQRVAVQATGAVAAASGSQVHGLGADGVRRWTWTAPATVTAIAPLPKGGWAVAAGREVTGLDAGGRPQWAAMAAGTVRHLVAATDAPQVLGVTEQGGVQLFHPGQ